MNTLLKICTITAMPAATYEILNFIALLVAKISAKDYSLKSVIELILKFIIITFFITFLIIYFICP